ncbi:MAG: AraC family transcriptional regulator [Planctomycetes bacterium]|nr:AraC family transcriptional regulator [Planctomycetota bacterium]
MHLQLGEARLCEPSWCWAPHRWTTHGLTYVLRGHGRFTCDDIAHDVVPGDLLTFRRLHRYAAQQDGSERLMLLYLRFFHEVPIATDPYLALPLPFLLRIGLGRGVVLRHRFIDLIALAHADQRPVATLAVRSGLLATFVEAERLAADLPADARIGAYGRLSWRDDPIREAQQWIDQHWLEPLAIAAIARRAGLQAAHFSRRFAAVVGASPARYLRDRRLAHACELLRSSDVPIAVVAREAGFRDAFYFSRVFQAEHGVSPRQFRSANGAGEA